MIETKTTETRKLVSIGVDYFLLSDDKIQELDHFVGFEHGIRSNGCGWYMSFHDGSNRSKLSSISKGASKIIATTIDIDGLGKLDKFRLDIIIGKNDVEKHAIGFAEFLNENRWYNFDKAYNKWCYTFEGGTSIPRKTYEKNHMKTSSELFLIYKKHLADRVWKVEVEMELESRVMGGGLLPMGKIGGKGNTQYVTYKPRLDAHNRIIINKLS